MYHPISEKITEEFIEYISPEKNIKASSGTVLISKVIKNIIS